MGRYASGRREARAGEPRSRVVDRQRGWKISPVRVEVFAEFTLERLGLHGSQVTVLLVGERAMRALNRTWRGRDRVTDVLSFSQREGAGGGLHPEVLGDVVVCVPVARRQAGEARHCLAAELDRLVAHGLLHLAGYEHEGDPQAARRMRRREAAIIRSWRR
jgi:probable rRNA maturation factor